MKHKTIQNSLNSVCQNNDNKYTNAVLVDKTRFEILCTFSVYRGPQTLFLTSPFRSPFVKTTDPYTYAVRVELAD